MQIRALAILVAQFSFTRGELQAEPNGRARLVNISGRLQVNFVGAQAGIKRFCLKITNGQPSEAAPERASRAETIFH